MLRPTTNIAQLFSTSKSNEPAQHFAAKWAVFSPVRYLFAYGYIHQVNVIATDGCSRSITVFHSAQNLVALWEIVCTGACKLWSASCTARLNENESQKPASSSRSPELIRRGHVQLIHVLASFASGEQTRTCLRRQTGNECDHMCGYVDHSFSFGNIMLSDFN